jgi:hypothetical protein
MKIKTVTTVEELGENGKNAVKPLQQTAKSYSMTFEKLGVSLITFIAACWADKVVMKQNAVAELARCNKGYISRIEGAIKASAKVHGGDFQKAEAEAKELGIGQFLAKYKPTATQRGESTNKAQTNKPAKPKLQPAQGLGLDDMLAMARNLHETVARNLQVLDQQGKQELSNQLMDTWDMLQQREVRQPTQERRVANA